MPKIFYLICFLFLTLSCSKDYIEKEVVNTPSLEAISLLSTYVSVDFAEVNIDYNWSNIFEVQIRREESEYPLTAYDGDLVATGMINKTSFVDYQQTKDSPSLTTNRTYYYSIFYTTSDDFSNPVRIKDFKITTLSYKQGMLQLFQELVEYAKSKNNAYQFVLSTELMALFFDDVSAENPTYENPELMRQIHGILVPSSSKTKMTQEELNQQNNQLLSEFSDIFPRVNVDDGSNLNVVNSQLTQDNDIFITKIGGIQKVIFVDTHVDDLLGKLKNTEHDLIVMSPFIDNHFSSNVYSKEDVHSLKTNSNQENRLVFAYIDVGRLWKNWDGWDSQWDNQRPNWIDDPVTINSDDYRVKYWRRNWKEILISVMDQVMNSGYDGFVFGGGESYEKYEQLEE